MTFKGRMEIRLPEDEFEAARAAAVRLGAARGKTMGLSEFAREAMRAFAAKRSDGVRAIVSPRMPAQQCGLVMVGSGTDTYDPVCELSKGHRGDCMSSAAIDQHRLDSVALETAPSGRGPGTPAAVTSPCGSGSAKETAPTDRSAQSPTQPEMSGTHVGSGIHVRPLGAPTHRPTCRCAVCEPVPATKPRPKATKR